MGFLTDHCARVRAELASSPLDVEMLAERAQLQAPTKDFWGDLRTRGARASGGIPAVIAEVKRASPSAGVIRDADPADQARAYAAAGATAISVLTEPRHFGGSLLDLGAVRRVVDVPVMRKDFLVHPDQIVEARANGADAVLLIATVLDPAELAQMLSVATDLGLHTLVEAFGERDLGIAVDSGAQAIGVNARDLESLEVDEGQALDLLGTIPDDRVRVFESGIASHEQVRRAVDAGGDAILVGTALMQADDPGEKLRELLGEVA